MSSPAARRRPVRGEPPRTVHRVAVGETVVADRTAVLTARTAGSAMMIARDPWRALAAATHFALPRNRRELARQSQSVPVAVFAPLVARGCRPEDVEIYTVGPGLPIRPPGRMALGYRPAAGGGAQRIEFRVDTGRMVVEKEIRA